MESADDWLIYGDVTMQNARNKGVHLFHNCTGHLTYDLNAGFRSGKLASYRTGPFLQNYNYIL